MGKRELLEDERFATLEARAEHGDEINDLVAVWCSTKTAAEIEETLVAHQVPVSRVYSIDEILDDPHVQARGSIVEVDDPQLRSTKPQAPVPRPDRTPPA